MSGIKMQGSVSSQSVNVIMAFNNNNHRAYACRDLMALFTLPVFKGFNFNQIHSDMIQSISHWRID